MSGLGDARVLSAFSTGIQRPYMLGVEQRLTSAVNSVDELVSASQTLNHSIVYATGSSTTTSTTYVDTVFTTTLVSSGERNVLLIVSFDDFWVSSTTSDVGYLGVSFDGGTEKLISQTFKGTTNANTYGVSASAIFPSVVAGAHRYTLRFKTTAGTLYLGGSSGSQMMVVMEL